MSTEDARSPEPVAGNLACQPCGYNLRGLLRSDQCPECGTEVELSWPVFTTEMSEKIGQALRLAEHGTIVHFVGLLTVILHPIMAVYSGFMFASATRRLRTAILGGDQDES